MTTRTILLVEDDALIAEGMADVLRRAGYAVAPPARTLAEAVAVVRHQPVDLAVLDVELRGSKDDGVAVARAILAHRPIPLIYVTGHTDTETLGRVKSTQPVAFLSKPFHPVDLTMQVALVFHSLERDRKPMPALLPDCLLLPDNGQWVNVRQAEVVFAEASTNFTFVHVFNCRNPYVVTNNLKNVAPQLTLPTFYQLSRSYVVNLHYLAGLKVNQLMLRLSDNPKVSFKTFSIPAERRASLMQRLPFVKAR
ncbi:MAG: response regulator [Cytophagaceae bacterium]|nr:response regulator [Cytophagaceae bacterium]